MTPSFNQARWLADNLRSVECQSYPNIEHVVMDGGSTDGSVDILCEAGEGIRWRSEPDRGQSHALNKAFAASRGEIIGWINSDDAYFDCRVVEDVVRFFETHPDVDLVYGHAASVNADGMILHLMWVPGFRFWWFRMSDFIVQPAAFIRRRAVSEPLVDESLHFAMDYDLWLRTIPRDASARRRAVARVDRILAIDRVQPGRKSLLNRDVLLTDMRELAKRYGISFRVVTGALSARLVLAPLHVMSRFLGAWLVRTIPADLAFTVVPSTPAELLRRQLATRRSRMPVGSE